MTGDLIAPIRAGLAAVDTLVAGTLEADIRAALDRAAQEFGMLGEGGSLAALRRLAETASGSGDLAALREAVEALIALATPGTVPESSLDDALAGVFSMLEAIGAMMTLETLLGEVRRLGNINAGRLPAGRAESLLAAVEAEIAAAAAALDGIDPDDTAAVDAAIAALALCRTSMRALIEVLREGMATGEATLTLIDASGLLARVEAVLVRLRGTALADVRDTATALSAKLQPLFAFDLGDAEPFTLDALLTEVEGRVAEIAGLIGSFDTAVLTAPVETALGTVTTVAEEVSGGIEAVLGAVTDALAGIRDAIRALPLDAVANALGRIVGALADALATLADLLGSVEELIGDGAQAAQAALERAEAAVTVFRDDVEAAFAAARDFIDGLGIDDAIGTVADAIQTVSDAIGQADMAPYFATAEDSVGTAADVIDKVSFDLLPDSMEQEVVDLVRPIKTVDLDAFTDDIREILQINPDGTFSLRPDLEAAVQTIQD
ncbi:MAG: hypothetical protein ACR2N5_02755, partial [Solirubrobacterales bacterium]